MIFWVSFFTISTFWEPRRSANDKAILFNARAFHPHITGMVEHGDTEGRFFWVSFFIFFFFWNREVRVARIRGIGKRPTGIFAFRWFFSFSWIKTACFRAFHELFHNTPSCFSLVFEVFRIWSFRRGVFLEENRVFWSEFLPEWFWGVGNFGFGAWVLGLRSW
jgi:hypothetical protein